MNKNLKVRVLGSHGGIEKGKFATSFLVNDSLLVDAGCAAHRLTLSEQSKINSILITHSHLDHIKDLAFLADNFFARENPFKIYGSRKTLEMLKKHLFNDVIWPDFSRLPSKEAPTIKFCEINVEENLFVENLVVTPAPVNHIEGSLAYFIESEKSEILMTGDTGPTEEIWKIVNSKPKLKAIFSEISFVNSQSSIARVSYHHTPRTFSDELKKIKNEVSIYVGHLKPVNESELISEIKLITDKRIKLLDKDDITLVF